MEKKVAQKLAKMRQIGDLKGFNEKLRQLTTGNEWLRQDESGIKNEDVRAKPNSRIKL